MHPQQCKWGGKYASAPAPSSAGACAVLRDNTHLLPAKGLALSRIKSSQLTPNG